MANSAKNSRWYVVQTKPMNEERVCLQFTRLSDNSSSPGGRRLGGGGVSSEATSAISPLLQKKFIGADVESPVSLRAAGEAIPRHDSSATSSDIETFCPKLRSVSLSKGSEKITYRPLFPNYVFLKMDLSDPANHHLVKYTRGVNKVLGDGEKPVPISNEVIEIIRGRTNAGGIIEQNLYKKGDMVKVKKGHLKELIGVLDKPVSDTGRVSVLLTLFNRQMRVQMHCGEIGRA